MNRSRGFALVPAIFLLVVLGVLGLVAVRIGTGEQQSVTMNLLQARALAAASSGVEWGTYSALNGTCPASTTLTLTEGALNGFSVVVTCSATSYYNGATAATSVVVNSTATSGTYGNPNYVRRVVSSTSSNAYSCTGSCGE